MKKFLAMILAVAIVLTGVVPVNFANAATTTVQNDGLNMDTDRYSPYMTDAPLKQLPSTIEATIRLPISTTVYRAGIIVGNARYESSTTGEVGVFNFGFFKGMIPYLYVADTDHPSGHFYLFGEYTGSGNLTSDYKVETAETERMRATFSTGEWTHVAVVNDVEANEMSLYVNGELFYTIEDTSYSDTFKMTKQVWLGGDRRGSGNSQRLRGDIKNLAMYSDARTATEVKADYQNGVASSEQGLMASYEMALRPNGAYPRTLTDLSGNGNDFKLPWLTEEDKEAYAPRQDYDYSMAVIGDQQIVSANTANNKNGKVNQVFQWVVDQVDARKIKFAFNLGDITDNNSEAQWEAGLPALQQLDGALPYSIVRGNHDYVEQYKEKVTYEHYKGQLEGSFDGTMLNTYQKFRVGDIKYMVVNLDFGVGGADTSDGDAVLAWANKIVADNPDYNVIVTTHAYLDADGTYLEPGDNAAASREKTGYYRDKDGIDIWNEFTSQHSNIVLVLSGHVGTEQIVKRESTGVHGNKVVEMLVNPQTTDQYLGVSGIVSMFYFSNGGKTVQVEYYSILRDLYYKEESQFTFNLNVIESPKEIVLENGTVLLEKAAVNTNGIVPVAKGEDFKDYVFAGWYKSANANYENAITDVSQVDENSYAKFIPKEILNVKAQVSNGTMSSGTHAGKYAIRFVSSVESLDYRAVGFKVTYVDANGNPQTKTVTSNTVYEKIKSNVDDLDYNFTPSAMTLSSKYFITAKLPVVNSDVDKARCYTVQAFLETADGSIVYGDSRCLSINDAKETILNTTVNVLLDAQKTYVAVCANDKQGTVQVLNTQDGHSNVRITFTQNVADILPSLSDITIKEVLGTDSYKEVETFAYRNYYTTHASGNAAKPNADTTWYTYDPMAKVFVVASSADLYGLAQLIDKGTTNFSGREIRLVQDVVINKGVAVPATSSTASKWVADAGELVYEWEPIGKDWGSGVNYFEGTFDGEGHTVSGVWLDNTTNYNGFFATAGPNSILKDFGVTNSYLRATHDYLGGVVAFARSQYLENLYSDAVLVFENTGSSNRSCVGGIVGRYGNPDATTNTNLRLVSGCWFDGHISANNIVTRVGGITGDLIQSLNIEYVNCLYTGEMVYKFTGTTTTNANTYPAIGGMYGYADNALNTRSFAFRNCVVAGKITVTYPAAATPAAGTFIGRTSAKSGGTTIQNCYSICDMTINGTKSTTNYGSLHRAFNWTVDCTVDRSSLLLNSEAALNTKFPLLNGAKENVWKCDVDENGSALGTPILKSFADCWLDKQ